MKAGLLSKLKVLIMGGIVALSVCLALPQTSSAADTVVTDIRVGHHSDKTRFVVDLSNPVPIRIFTLKDPFRVVFDMPEVGWRLPQQPLPSQVGIFKTMRYGLYQPGQSRVVVETTGPSAIKSAFFLPASGGAPDRFVLDMIAVSEAYFTASIKNLITVTANGGGFAMVEQPTIAIPSAVATIPQAPVPDNVPNNVTNNVKNALVVAPIKPNLQQFVKKVIVIDAGHGGADPGTIGRSGAYEKHITIAAARSIRDTLEATGRYKVVLTRDRDVFIRLRDRVAISRKAGADLFISIHADSIKDRSVHGASVYTLSNQASDKEAALLAKKENKADLIGGMDLSGETQEITDILIDLAQNESMNESAKFAKMLVGKMKPVTKVLSNAHRFAGFAVLKAPDVPSVLVELGFLSNITDEKNLRSKAFRKKVSMAILRAIDYYFAQTQQANSN